MTSKLNAEILPLTGKYYGTLIQINHPDFDFGTNIIKVWIGSDTPSRREVEAFKKENGHEPDDFEIVDLITQDGHFESDLDLFVAEKIVEALNGAEWPAGESINKRG